MARRECVAGLLILFLTSLCSACDVSYDFGSGKDAVATELKVSLTWWTVEPAEKANVYLSTATGTACNSGYFGAQFHSDGKGNSWQTLLFSMWDAPGHVGKTNHSDFPFQNMPVGENCWRNALDSSGKSTGVQCGQPWPHNPKASINVSLHLGVPYEFTLSMTSQNESGAQWEVTVVDPMDNKSISVGKMFFVDVPLGLPKTCRALGLSQSPPTQGLASYTFLEYFEAPFDYTTVASWTDMRAIGASGNISRVPDVVKDCCGHTYGRPPTGGFFDTSQKCLPPECDALEVRLMCGPYVKPSKSAIAANPGCDKVPPAGLRTSKLDCWQNGSPASLDQCFSDSATISLDTAFVV